MIRCLAVLCALCLLACAHAFAIEESDAFNDTYTAQHAIVQIDGVLICKDCLIYVDRDEAIYVASDDLDEWGLKRPRNPSFERDGCAYFGLQRDLRLAAAFNPQTHELEIVATGASFRGRRNTVSPQLNNGRGAFLNYTLTRENGRYDFFAAGHEGVFELRYLSTAGAGGLEFHRSRLRWSRVSPDAHRIISVGDNTSDGGWLGVSAPFAGVHYATDYASDPQYAPHAPPSVSGFAESPSRLEIYVDDLLELRTDVPAGPFRIGDLPASAAHADIVMVLTDRNGKQTVQVARPSYDGQILGRGFSQFRIDAGAGHANLDNRGQYYHGLVAQAGFEYGLTDNITANLLGESVSGENFLDAGADVRLGANNQFGFRAGTGNKRRASEYRYEVRRGIFSFRENFAFNSLRSQPIPEFDNGDVVAQITERSSLDVDVGNAWTVGLAFSRSRSSNGSNVAALSTRASYRFGALSLEMSPFYDYVSHRVSADLSINLRTGAKTSITTKAALTPFGATTTGVTWNAERAGPGGQLTTKVNLGASAFQERGATVEDQLSWADASMDWQQQNGASMYEPSLAGALAFLGGNVYAVRRVNESEAFGLVRVPGLPNIEVDVNGTDLGKTNKRGELLLRDLAPYTQNTIDLKGIPISYNLVDPLRVVPGQTSPLALTVRVISHGDVTFTAVDDRGAPLPAGSWLDGPSRYPIGYGGHVFVAGISPGMHRLAGRTASGRPCTIELKVPSNIDDVPDLGNQRCL